MYALIYSCATYYGRQTTSSNESISGQARKLRSVAIFCRAVAVEGVGAGARGRRCWEVVRPASEGEKRRTQQNSIHSARIIAK